jgi:hypothetical protein
MEQRFVVNLDPRVKAPAAALQAQFDLSMRAYAGMGEAFKALSEVRSTRKSMADAVAKQKSASKKKALQTEDAKIAAFDETGFAQLNQQLGQILDALQEVDDAPTSALLTAFEEKSRALGDLLNVWPKAQAAARQALR